MSSPNITDRYHGNLLSTVSQGTSPSTKTPEISEKASQSPFNTQSEHPNDAGSLAMDSSIGHPVVDSIEAIQEYIKLAIEELFTDDEEEAIQPQSIATGKSKRHLSRPLTKFTLFPKLPLELRLKIFNLASEPQAVWISRHEIPESRQVISMVCKEAKVEYERQWKVLKKRSSEFHTRFGPVFVNYRDDYIHFFHTTHGDRGPVINWEWIMTKKLQRGCDIVHWLKPAQRVTIRLRQKTGNRGLCAPHGEYDIVWEQFNRICPAMKELIFIIAAKDFPMEDLVELKNFGGRIGDGEAALRSSFAAAQLRGFNVSAKLVIMGSPEAWDISKGKLVEVVDLTGSGF
ncbi:hypothetical protein VTL71DRAFT_500 [Oculimacula yallundae]|uniref:2EXR domain-containing protein n=1 Tax=Oculimacula yallundae TaxID=86028 RepID=A0ABR4D164_9HELO